MLDGEEGLKHRVGELVPAWLYILSEYEGKQCPELSLRMLCRALQHLGVEVPEVHGKIVVRLRSHLCACRSLARAKSRLVIASRVCWNACPTSTRRS